MHRRRFIKSASGALLVPAVNLWLPRKAQGSFFYSAATPAGPAYLVNQNFENTGSSGYDHSETWTEAGTGTINSKYTTTVLVGSQSLYINKSAQTASVLIDFAASSEVWVFVKFRPVTLPPANFNILAIQNTNTSLLNLIITSAGLLRVHGSNTVSAMSAATTYDVFCHYKAGSGANGITSGSFTTDGTRLTSGNAYKETTTGTQTLSANRLRISLNVSETGEMIVDHVLVLGGATPIADNP